MPVVVAPLEAVRELPQLAPRAERTHHQERRRRAGAVVRLGLVDAKGTSVASSETGLDSDDPRIDGE